MTPAQTQLYFREWGRVRAACKAQNLPIPDRHQIHIRALGRDKSSKKFSNDDFDAVLAHFRAISDPDNLAPQIREHDQPRTRMLWLIRNDKIRELAHVLDAPENTPASDRLDRARKYVATLIQDQFKSLDLDDLTDPQLRRLLATITRATNQRRKSAGLTWPELRSAAGTARKSTPSDDPC